MSLRILQWANAPWTASGYGVQTKLMVPRMRAMGHKMAILGYYGVQGGVINWDGIPVFPSYHGSYGQESVPAIGAAWQADVVISLIDLWVCDFQRSGGFPVAAYFPLDADRMSKAIYAQAKAAYRRIVMARSGERQCHEMGLDCTYIPHMVDTNAYSPMEPGQARQAEMWSAYGVTPDTFLVGMVQANVGRRPARKAFHEQFAAFKLFHDRHPDSVLYVHSNMALNGELGGINLPALAEYLELPTNAIIFPDPFSYALGYKDEEMRLLYNSLDVLLQVTLGEGCGLPAIESAACGTPVISAGWSGTPEHNYHGWIVPEERSQKWYITEFGVSQWTPEIPAIVECLEMAYDGARSETRKRKAARAAKANHDADDVARRLWRPFLLDLERDLEADGLLFTQRVERSRQAQAAPEMAALEAGE